MRLKEKLKNNKKIITTEVTFPRVPEIKKIKILSRRLIDIDAVNITCNPLGKLHISSIAGAVHLKEKGIEPILQICTRDMNRLQLQSEILGAHSLDITNLLIISGDKIGKKTAVEVHDITVPEMIKIVSEMNAGTDGYKNKIRNTSFTIGAALDQSRKDFMDYTSKKIESGAQFFQTQVVDDLNIMKSIIESIKKNNPHIKIIPTIMHIKSENMMRYIEKRIWGIKISKQQRELILSPDSSKKALRSTIKLAKKIIEIADGVHIIPMGCYEDLPKIIKRLR